MSPSFEGGVLLDEGFWSRLEIRNESGVEVDRARVIEHVRNSPEVAAISDWALDAHSYGNPGRRRHANSLLDRDRYVTPYGVHSQYRVAYDAATSDDIVSGVLQSTEGLAFSKMRMEAEDPDQEDVWNQLAGDLDLDSRLREVWRELFIYSQVVIATYWGNKTYKVRGLSKKGVKRKKDFSVQVPLGMTLLDPYKVVPVGNFFFNRERLAYLASPYEVDEIDAVINGDLNDPTIGQLMVGKYTMTDMERRKLDTYGVLDYGSADRMYLLNPRTVFRHVLTRSQYEPFANVRMKAVFELLDMKHQLRQSDRVHLIGATNFIVLIKKGSDTMPATQKEINALQGYARTLARMPMLVGDHRLAVEIVTPDQDFVLVPEKYNAIDARITANLYQMFMTGNFAAGAKGDDSIKLARVVARGLESRRHMIKRSIEQNIFKHILEENTLLDALPDLRFTPKRIALDFDANLATFMLELAQMGNLSRDTLLSEYDFDQDEEARKRKREEELGFDKIFQTAVPFSSPAAQPFTPKGAGGPAGQSAPGQRPPGSQTPRLAGRSGGGIKNGGGAAPGTGQGVAKADLDEEFDDDD